MKEIWASLKKVRGAQLLFLLLALCVFGSLLLNRTATGASGKTDMETRAEGVLSKIAGAGAVSVVVYTQKSGDSLTGVTEKPVGAVIVARGARDPAVRLMLLSAAKTLFSLPANAIEVFEMEAE